MTISRAYLDELYHQYNHREYVPPDPLEFVWRYEDPLEREIVGFIASALAYGRVAQIKRSVAYILDKMGPTPRAFIEDASREHLLQVFDGFKHRFTTAFELAEVILGIQRVISLHGSLEHCFLNSLKSTHDSTIQALGAFVQELRSSFPDGYNSLLPHPEKKSACKRLHLFLRWMVRRDEVDPGVWDGVSPSLLVVPLDTHMYSICSHLGMTCRASSDMKTSLEITACFRNIIPDDPVRYDFALTRLGIRPDVECSAGHGNHARLLNDNAYLGGKYGR